MIRTVFSVFLVVALVSADSRSILKALHSHGAFARLLKSNMARFHQHYSQAELRSRAKLFRQTLKEVAKCNSRHANFHCDVNEFSTLTDTERQQHLGLGNLTGLRSVPVGRSFRLMSLQEKDWREGKAVTAVKNQGSCGSCWAFASAASIEGTYAITTGKLRSFSDQELLECTYEHAPGYNGCYGGWMFDAFEYLKQHQHLASAVDRPYAATDGYCYKDQTPNSAKAVKFTGYLKTAGDERSLLDAVSITPTTVAMLAKGDFFSYSSGAYDGAIDCQGASFPNHALTAVGFTRNVFIIKNSWGAEWGDSGYINVARTRNVCFVNDFAYYATMEKIGEDDGPTDSPSPTGAPQPENCKEPEEDEACEDVSTNCYYESQYCYVSDDWITWSQANCRRSCRFCGVNPIADLVEDCGERVRDRGCGDAITKAVCPRTCCEPDDGADGCPSGTVRCPNGECRHEHMCHMA